MSPTRLNWTYPGTDRGPFGLFWCPEHGTVHPNNWCNECKGYKRIRLVAETQEHLVPRVCRTCNGIGSIHGFLLGTVKKCPACNGRGTFS